ncbi:major capsid protein [Peromfec virus RodF8_60]|uniref:Major capsid protein n=1 Tax=Peromfec virus RodF8_60 TaxID=2929386 RepID=A0A976R875_9VIRU|nr:major capsid protein [Peromfec virus RodF8_60]
MVGKVAPYKTKRNYFNLGHPFHFTAKMGYAYPTLALAFLPGDSLKVKINQLARMMPLQTPTMSNIKGRLDFFRVDYGVVWPNFYKFIKQNGSEENPIEVPYNNIPDGGFPEGELADFLKIEPLAGDGVKYSMLPFRCYQKIINDYYLNTNIQDEIPIGEGDGLDVTTPTTLRKVNWKRDRFTNAQTTTQSGGDVILPIGQKARLCAQPNTSLVAHDASDIDGPKQVYFDSISNNAAIRTLPGGSSGQPEAFADLTTATGVSLRALSTARYLQEYRTRDLFAGDRYPDWQYMNWGVPSSDARLQRSEWLGGFKWNFITSEVLQTSETTSTSAQGTMAGHGFSYGDGNIYISKLNNYGMIFAIFTVMPEPTYQQGMDRMFSKFSPFDFALPLFSHMPMQAIKNQELFLQKASVVDSNGDPVNEGNFGFEPVFDDYRSLMPHVAGQFRSSLSFWLMTRIFDSLPKLNEDFIQADPTDRIFAVSSEKYDPLQCSHQYFIDSLRHLPKEGLPKF